MKTQHRRYFVFLCVLICCLSLTACKGKTPEDPVPDRIEQGMKSGARSYLTQFVRYDDTSLADELERQQRQQNTVMESALCSWMACREDLGAFLKVASEQVERIGDREYQVTLETVFEFRRMKFVLTAEEMVKDPDNENGMLVPTELSFYPVYQPLERLENIAGTVFLCTGMMCLLLFCLALLTGLSARIIARKE